MASYEAAVAVDIDPHDLIRLEDEIVAALMSGPKCASQIQIETGARMAHLKHALKNLHDRGEIKQIDDLDRDVDFDDEERPWTLTRWR